MKLKLVAFVNKKSVNDPMNPVNMNPENKKPFNPHVMDLRLPDELVEIKPKIDKLTSTLTTEQIKEIVETGAKEIEEKYGLSITPEEINQIINELKDFKVAGLSGKTEGKIFAYALFLLGIVNFVKGQASFAPGSTVSEMQAGLMRQIAAIGFAVAGTIILLLKKYWIKDQD